jgi:hypothetical protein
MKKLLINLFVFLLFGLSLHAQQNKTGPVVSYSHKMLSGSFIDFSGKLNWTQKDWEDQFQEMKDIGMNIAIIQYIAYADTTWYNSENTFTTTKCPNALPRLLAAANTKHMDIHIGLYFDEEYWQNQTNVDWLRLHADRCVLIATELNSKFGKDAAFKGWYIPHEPEPNAYHSAELVHSFNDNLINRISDKLHAFDAKPVSIAAFFNSELTSPELLKDFMKELCRSNLQIIMLQDGIGVNHVSLDKVGKYFSQAGRGLYENSKYTGEYWTDLETFSFAPQGPVTIDRIKTQLREEMKTPNLTKAIIFQYYNDMSPAGHGGKAAMKLRNDYLGFIKSQK